MRRWDVQIGRVQQIVPITVEETSRMRPRRLGRIKAITICSSSKIWVTTSQETMDTIPVYLTYLEAQLTQTDREQLGSDGKEPESPSIRLWLR